MIEVKIKESLYSILLAQLLGRCEVIRSYLDDVCFPSHVNYSMYSIVYKDINSQ